MKTGHKCKNIGLKNYINAVSSKFGLIFILPVPMQILLDKEGKEFFRHYGFIPADELEKEFRKKTDLNRLSTIANP